MAIPTQYIGLISYQIAKSLDFVHPSQTLGKLEGGEGQCDTKTLDEIIRHVNI